MTGDRILVRNVGLNFAGQVVPLFAALIAIPIFVKTLGTDRFSILTLVWAAIGYFSLFDFGVARAVTHAIATRVGTDADVDVPAVTWTALALMLGFGMVGGVVLAGLTPMIIERGLNVPDELHHEARTAFYLMAGSLPFLVLATGLRGVMEAYQDFRTATALRVPIGVLMYVAPLGTLAVSRSLIPVVAILFGLRVVSCLAHLVVALVRYKAIRHGIAVRGRLIGPLIRYGGWMTVSNVVSPIMVNMDRFMIAAMLTMTSVAYYVTPYEVVTRLFLIPAAVLGVLFPALATTLATDRDRALVLVDRSVRVITITVFPAALLLVLFANEGLTAWVGAAFAHEGAPVLRWLAAGVLINCTLGQVSFTILQGAGRPDLTAKAHLVELPLYLAVTFFLVRAFGLTGVAVAWTLRVSVDAVVLAVWASRRVDGVAEPMFRAAGTLAVATLALMVAAALPTTGTRAIGLVVGLVTFGAVAWTRLLSPQERLATIEWLRALITFRRTLRPASRD